MSRTHVFALSGLLFLAAAVMTTPARAETRRYAVVIGANVGDPQDARLHFAEADAAKVAHTLRSVGEFPAGQILQMNGVSADEVRRSLIELNARLRQETADSVLLVYYSGHADAENLHLDGTHLGARELRDILAGSSAGSRVLVIDACRSGAVTRVKGGSPTPPFAINLSEVTPPTGIGIKRRATKKSGPFSSVRRGEGWDEESGEKWPSPQPSPASLGEGAGCAISRCPSA